MVVGPIEYIIVGFPGSKFNGQIAPELAKLIDSRLVRILDLVIISKDESGDVGVFEFDQLDELAPFADLEGEVGGIVGQEDIDYAAASLAPGSSLGLLVWEDLGLLPSPPPYVSQAAYSSKAGASPTSWRKRLLPASNEPGDSTDGRQTDRPLRPNSFKTRRSEMLRRRPVMRMAATTAVVAGTATAVSGGVRRHQDAKAEQAQAAAEAEAPRR